MNDRFIKVTLLEDAEAFLDNMKQYSFEEVLDKHIGKAGTPERDQFDKEVDEAVSAYRIGEAIKAERLRNNLTQAQLGERGGVQWAQISRNP